MLKRFMNWLLNKMQSIAGIVSGRRSKPRPSESSTIFRDRVAQLSQQSRQVDLAVSNIPIAERDSFSLSTEPLIEPVTPADAAAENLIEPVAATESFVDQKPTDSASVHSHSDANFNVISTDLSDDVSVKPTFPTEVSELIGSPSIADAFSFDENISADFPVRTLKKLPDGQLPEIHDLLPAVEALPAEPVLYPADIPAPSQQSKPVTAPKLSDDLSLASEQAVLFSFDITQSEEPVALSKIPEASVLIDSESEQAAVGPESSQLKVEKSPTPSEAPQSPSGFQPVSELSEPIVNAKSLPYPWLLPAPEVDLQPESEARSVKNGVVKLLFMLKEGNFHGYIAPDDGTKDILFHQKHINADIFSRLERGAKVAASVKYMEGKVYATHVTML